MIAPAFAASPGLAPAMTDRERIAELRAIATRLDEQTLRIATECGSTLELFRHASEVCGTVLHPLEALIIQLPPGNPDLREALDCSRQALRGLAVMPHYAPDAVERLEMCLDLALRGFLIAENLA